MSLKEILEVENGNKDSIYLIKEGIFWRGYERSAYYFVKNIKEFKLLKRYFKVISGDLVYLGFPDDVLDKILIIAKGLGKTLIQKDEKLIEIKGFEEIDDFEEWKSRINIENKEEIKVTNFLKVSNFNPWNVEGFCKKIMNYPLEGRTPLETMQFVKELKEELYH
jgi:hypothetical protein